MTLDSKNTFLMPLQSNHQSYSTCRNLSHRLVTRRATQAPAYACLTTYFAPHPYPSIEEIIGHMDISTADDAWYNHPRDDLYYRDFIFQN